MRLSPSVINSNQAVRVRRPQNLFDHWRLLMLGLQFWEHYSTRQKTTSAFAWRPDKSRHIGARWHKGQEQLMDLKMWGQCLCLKSGFLLKASRVAKRMTAILNILVLNTVKQIILALCQWAITSVSPPRPVSKQKTRNCQNAQLKVSNSTTYTEVCHHGYVNLLYTV